VVIAVTLLIAVLFVARSLRQPELIMYAPTAVAQAATSGSQSAVSGAQSAMSGAQSRTPAAPSSAGRAVAWLRFTVDAASSENWQYFDFSSGSLVGSADPVAWDIAVRRFHVIANGGPAFSGTGGIIDLGPVPFDSVTEAPRDGFVETVARRDSVNAAIDRWYSYSWITHLLESKEHVYIVRTADGRYAKMRVLSYYCPGAVAGCFTFEYVYQPNGDRSFDATSQ
jgi:hypothetical protein